MTATLTTRPAYDGPRTRFTRPDGVYRLAFSIPFRDLPVGDVETPALAHASIRVASALGRPGAQGTSAMAGSHWPRFAPRPLYGVGFVEVSVEAGSDEEAAEIFTRVSEEVGSVGGLVQYLQPTEHGASAGPDTEVLRIEKPDVLPG